MNFAGLAVLMAVVVTSVGCASVVDAPTTPAASAQAPSSSPPLPPETFRTVTPPPPPQPRPPEVRSVTAADLGTTWRPGCPAAPEVLRRVDLDFWGFDGQTHRGSLVVHEELTAQVIDIFGELHRLRYPIEKMRTVDAYPDADDELSMRDNNTSAFNCRDIPGTGSWSWHAYGRAVDVNPKLNPYIDRNGGVEPANAGPWVDRSRTDPGMLHDGDPAVLAFTDREWTWGGHWRTPLDYQHFEFT